MRPGERALDYAIDSGSESFIDDVLDDVLPENLDWRRLVRNHPAPVLALAALGGFVIGRSRGRAVLGALSTFAASALATGVNRFLGDDVV
jgi:hypothetical protein